MSKPTEKELGDTWPRFFAHWSAAALGCFLQTLLPLMKTWTDPAVVVDFPRWWVSLLSGAIFALIASTFNANCPVTPRELMKSLALGFAVNSAAIMLKIG